ncbi:hypothetical protein COO60DRAFT_1458943 [Scenedesmus sp. NREL 46B-D3]|nr:hypothetical protein COO60DRAFT_1458943 [Scenedesmus sp. NREL 46B-D3]
MDEEQSRGHAHSATPSRSGSSDSGEEEFGTPATRNAERHQDAGPLLPHQLIPAHIKDKEKIDVRRGLLKTATKELGGLLHSLQGLQESSSSEELAAAVLCSKLMKRRTLLCCKADPQQPDCLPLRPLQVLCEAKVSAGKPSLHQELLAFLTQDASAAADLASHTWYCPFCRQRLPGVPLRGCDGCQLACHGACYTRTYGSRWRRAPTGARCACPARSRACGLSSSASGQACSMLRCHEPQAAAVPASKAGTARYTVPLLPNEVFRRAALTSSCLFNAVATTNPGYGPRSKAAAYYVAAEVLANEVMTKPAYKLDKRKRKRRTKAEMEAARAAAAEAAGYWDEGTDGRLPAGRQAVELPEGGGQEAA